MTYVVTGASGFLGRALVGALAEAGHSVMAVSRTPLLSAIQGVQTVQVDDYGLSPPGDALVHLAECNDVQTWERRGPEYLKQATGLLSKLLDGRYRRVVYASSAAVYGDLIQQPRSVLEPVSPSSYYTRAKLENEQLVAAAGGLSLRLANLYGPRMSNRTAVMAIAQQLSAAEEPIKIAALAPVRDFLWIEDAAKGVARLCDRRASGVFNLGSGCGISIGALATRMLELAGQAGRRVIETKGGGGSSHLVLDIGPILGMGWHPAVGLDKGLTRLMECIHV